MKKDKRKNLIIITIVLLIILVGTGIVMLLAQSDSKEKNEPNTKNEDNRCVEKLCISKVSTEENNGTESLIIVLKNEGKETIKEKCVKLSTKENSFDLCVTELQPEAEMMMGFSKKEIAGEDIKDFKLEKIKEKVEETPAPSPEVSQEVTE